MSVKSSHSYQEHGSFLGVAKILNNYSQNKHLCKITAFLLLQYSHCKKYIDFRLEVVGIFYTFATLTN